MQDLDQLSRMMPNMYMWYKDLQSIYIDCNSYTAQMYSLKKRLYVQGISDYEVPCKACEIADVFQQQDRFVVEKEIIQQYLTIAQYANDEWQIIIGAKSPLYDMENKIIGTFGYGMEVSKIANHIIQLCKDSFSLHGLKQSGYMLSENFTKKTDQNFKLSNRESESLFFLLRGKTVKEIARRLQLSPRTVEQYMENLRQKFNCASRSELISKAVEQGFFEYIPPKFLHNANFFTL